MISFPGIGNTAVRRMCDVRCTEPETALAGLADENDSCIRNMIHRFFQTAREKEFPALETARARHLRLNSGTCRPP